MDQQQKAELANLMTLENAFVTQLSGGDRTISRADLMRAVRGEVPGYATLNNTQRAIVDRMLGSYEHLKNPADNMIHTDAIANSIAAQSSPVFDQATAGKMLELTRNPAIAALVRSDAQNRRVIDINALRAIQQNPAASGITDAQQITALNNIVNNPAVYAPDGFVNLDQYATAAGFRDLLSYQGNTPLTNEQRGSIAVMVRNESAFVQSLTSDAAHNIVDMNRVRQQWQQMKANPAAFTPNQQSILDTLVSSENVLKNGQPNILVSDLLAAQPAQPGQTGDQGGPLPRPSETNISWGRGTSIGDYARRRWNALHPGQRPSAADLNREMYNIMLYALTGADGVLLQTDALPQGVTFEAATAAVAAIQQKLNSGQPIESLPSSVGGLSIYSFLRNTTPLFSTTEMARFTPATS